MAIVNSGPVMGTQGNVIFCRFGAAVEPAACPANGMHEVLATIRTAVAEINAVATETLSTSVAAALAEKEISRLLVRTLDRIDNIAFEANVLAASSGGVSATDAQFITECLLRIVSAGAAVNQ